MLASALSTGAKSNQHPVVLQVPRELGTLRKLRILHMGGNLEEEFAEARPLCTHYVGVVEASGSL